MNTALRVGRAVAVPVLAAVPALLALFLLGRTFGAVPTDFFPAYDFDQYLYTREAATFAAAGFDGGFYGGDNQTARLGRFGPHGAAYAVVYGGLGRLLGGWRDWLAPVGNMAVLTLALWASARRLSLGVFAGLALCLALFPPLLFLLPTAYQDAPQGGIGLVLALFLAGLAEGGPAAPRRRLWTALGLVLVASLTRPAWIVLFPAVFFCATPGRVRDAVRALALGGAAMGLAYGLFSLTASPWTVSSVASAGGLQGVLTNMRQNIGHLSNFADNRYHLLTLFLMLAATALALTAPVADKAARLRLAAIHLCNMAAPLVLFVALYNGSGRHLSRLLTAHCVLGLALCARTLARPSLVLAPVLAGGLALFPATLDQYAVFLRPAYDDFQGFRPRIAAQAKAMDTALNLGLQNASPWLRTLAIAVPDQAAPFLAAPAAYGIQLYGPRGLDGPLRPGFALLTPAAHDLAARHTPLTAVAETPAGTLYRNDRAFGLVPPDAAPDQGSGAR